MDGAWDEIAIYSPSGLWEASQSKDRWLKDLGLALKARNPLVNGLLGVFVLPSSLDGFKDYAAPRLSNFEDCPRERTCRIHYMPPEDLPHNHPLNAPGMGMIIFHRKTAPARLEQYKVLFGFTTGNTNMLVNGFIVKQPDVCEMIYSWLVSQMLDGRARPYVLNGKGPNGEPVSLTESLPAVREAIYLHKQIPAQT